MTFKPPTFDVNVRLGVKLDVFQRLTSDRPKWLASLENLAALTPAHQNVGLNHDEQPLRAIATLAKFRVPSWAPSDQELDELSQLDLILRSRPSLEVIVEREQGDWRAAVEDMEATLEGRKVLGRAAHENPVKALIQALKLAVESYSEWYGKDDVLH